MKISQMLLDSKVKPMQIATHPDLTRAAWNLKAAGHSTPLDAVIRDQRESCADKLQRMGM